MQRFRRDVPARKKGGFRQRDHALFSDMGLGARLVMKCSRLSKS